MRTLVLASTLLSSTAAFAEEIEMPVDEVPAPKQVAAVDQPAEPITVEKSTTIETREKWLEPYGAIAGGMRMETPAVRP